MNAQVKKIVKRFVGSESGTTATEYALMLTLIVLVAASAISGLGQNMSSTFATLDNGVNHVLP